MDLKGLLTKSYAGIPGWLIAAGGGVAIWWFFLRGGGSSGSSSSSGVSADSAYGLGYAQGLQAAQANGTAGTAGASDQQAPPIPGGPKPVSPGAPHPGAPPAAGGVGGFSSKGSRSSQWAGNYFHPTVTRRVVYSHYVRSAGGPAAHSAEVSRVASSAGVSEGRLKALNPVYTGKIRVS